MASAPDAFGNFVVQDTDEQIINLDDIEKEKEETSKKDYMILRILKKQGDKVLILWSNMTKSWINKNDVSEYAYTNQREIDTHNKQVKINASQTFNSIANKRAFIYGRISQTNKKIKRYNAINNTDTHKTTDAGSSSSFGPSSHPPPYSSIGYEFSDSIETQKEICYKACLEKNMLVDYAAYDEGVSGRNMKNINYELGAWCPYLKPGFHVLVVYTPDRLGRHNARVQAFLNTMIDRNIDVYFVKENILWNKDITSDKKRIIQHILTDAEYFSDQTSERIRNTISRKRAKGHKFGKPPFGFKAYRDIKGIRKFKVCSKEDLIIKEIIKMDKMLNMNEDTKTKTKKAKYSIIKERINKSYKRNLTHNMIGNIIKKQATLNIQSVKIANKNLDFINKKMFSLVLDPSHHYKASDFYQKIKSPVINQDEVNEEIDFNDMDNEEDIKKPSSKNPGLLDKTLNFLNTMKSSILG